VALLDDVGTDAHGAVIVDALAREGVATHLLRRDARATAVTVVLPSGGDRAFVTHLPSDGPSGPPDLATALDTQRPRWIHVAGTSPARTHADLTTLARRAGARVAFDPGWHDVDLDAAEVRALARRCDLLLPNRVEAARLADLPDAAADDAARLALDRLAETRTGAVTVVKDGANGAWGVGPDSPRVRHAAAPPTKVVDATGAGDVFDAAFLDAWIDGATLDAALASGAAAGAAAVAQVGGATGTPRREGSEP
jgi:sugar/nucleoside kinase (ribokinase family)